MIVAERSFDPKAQQEELETPTLPLVFQFSRIFFWFSNFPEIFFVWPIFQKF